SHLEIKFEQLNINDDKDSESHKIPYDVLDDSITNTILTHDEVIRRNHALQ
ncbi:34406_t:CDS:2, partial [Gigaspora margarita]